MKQADMVGIKLETDTWSDQVDFEGLVARLGISTAEDLWDEVNAKLTVIRHGVTYRRLEAFISYE